MNKQIRILIAFTVLIAAVFVLIFIYKNPARNISISTTDNLSGMEDAGEFIGSYPLSIVRMRTQSYPGSEINIEENLRPGSNYQRYVASYKSEGLKINALLTVPDGQPPQDGWPVIIFNHGYIPPAEYRTTERYIEYADAFSRNGYIVFKSDYRGHGDSQGNASGGYGSPAYAVDILNAVSSIKNLKNPLTNSGQTVDANRIGMWGHSMGGFIALRIMVISKDIKAGVIWGGVVASYPDLVYSWRRSTFTPAPLPSGARRWRDTLIAKFGTPEKNPEFWNSISANSYLEDISGPVQLHHGVADASVPIEFSEKLEKQLKEAGKTVEFYSYPKDDHNITNNFDIAIQRSVEFFNRHLKNQKN